MGMFTAVLSVLSILTIPMPTGVPVTLQTFAMALCGYVLGWKKGTSSTLIYILLGTVGVPVFAGMTGGPSWLAGYSGGFIWGFIFLTMLCGVGMAQKQIWLRVLLGLAGLAVCHLLGVIQFAIVAATPFPAAFVAVSVPYIVKDVISVVRVSGGNSDPQGACSRKYSGREDKSGSLGVYSYYGRQIQRTSHRLYFAL